MKEKLLCGIFFGVWIASLTHVLHQFKKWRKQSGIECEVSLSRNFLIKKCHIIKKNYKSLFC